MKRSDLPVLASGFAGALALAVSTYNVYLQRAQVQAQVWPHLEWSYSNVNDTFSWNLANVGVGPAIVKGARVTVDGTPVASAFDTFHLLRPGYKELKELELEHSTFAKSVIPPGVMVHPLQIAHLASNDPFVQAQNDRLVVEICYCSTLSECWILRNHDGSAPVSSCPLYPRFD
jgi:hypothetical protein